jgi:carotenoid cleavage dioxygenase-like enzyme
MKEMVKNGEFIFKFDPTKKARFGILQRYEKDDKSIRWFELPNCFIFHNGIPAVTNILLELWMHNLIMCQIVMLSDIVA